MKFKTIQIFLVYLIYFIPCLLEGQQKINGIAYEQATSSVQPSFGQTLEIHNQELSSLDNYYSNVSNQQIVVDEYDQLMTDMYVLAVDQGNYMSTNNLDLNDLRILYSNDGFTAYSNGAQITIDRYGMSQEIRNRLNDLVQQTENQMSPYLRSDVLEFRDYINAGSIINYTPLEIVQDSYGGSLGTGTNDMARLDSKPLSKSEARRKLDDLVKQFEENKLDEVFDTQIYPQPVDKSLDVKLFSSTEGIVILRLFDSSGRLIDAVEHKTDGSGNMILSYDFPQGEKFSSHLYFYELLIPGKDVESGRILKK